MKLKLLFALLIVTISNAQTQIGQDITLGANFLDAVALSENGNALAVSSGNVVQVYSKVSGNWVQVGQDIQQYGYRIMLSNDGSTIAITSHGNLNLVRVYENINNNWTQIGQDIAEDGHDIALSGDGAVLAIAPMANSQFNIYKNISGTWTNIGSINTPGGAFSVCLSENGDTIATSPHPGTTIDINKFVNNKWVYSNTIVGNPNDVSTGYRMDMSSDGSTIAVTTMAVYPNNMGSIKVYRYINNTWIQIGNAITSQVPSENFGSNVAISGSGNVVIVGTREDGNTGNGRVEIHEYSQGNWVKKGEVIDQNGNKIEWAIALSRDGNSLALKSNGKIGPKPATSTTDDGSNPDNYQGKGTSSEVRVYDISGILSSDKFVLENFKIYPNPATNVVNITNSDNMFINQVQVYDLSGKLITTQNFNNETEIQLNVETLKPETYLIHLQTNQGITVKKLIKK